MATKEAIVGFGIVNTFDFTFVNPPSQRKLDPHHVKVLRTQFSTQGIQSDDINNCLILGISNAWIKDKSVVKAFTKAKEVCVLLVIVANIFSSLVLSLSGVLEESPPCIL